MRRILITGGTGVLGRECASRLRWSILRVTQFHNLLDGFLQLVARYGWAGGLAAWRYAQSAAGGGRSPAYHYPARWPMLSATDTIQVLHNDRVESSGRSGYTSRIDHRYQPIRSQRIDSKDKLT